MFSKQSCNWDSAPLGQVVIVVVVGFVVLLRGVYAGNRSNDRWSVHMLDVRIYTIQGIFPRCCTVHILVETGENSF